MREVNLSGLDLNLLPPLEALLKRRNVSEAARDVGLSQPAMSRALARLRETLGDPLLVRAPGGGYGLTARAEGLLTELGETLDRVRAVFREPGFNPADVRRTFRIAGLDAQTVLLAPALMARLALEAPGIDIRFENYSPDLVGRMETGRLDLAFATASTPLPPGAYAESYAHDRLALVMRRDNPLAHRAWRIEDYGQVLHVGVSVLGDAGSELDAQLARAGVMRRMALVTPHFMAALATVSATDMVTTIGRSLAERFADVLGLALLEPPLPVVELDLTLVWSRLRAADPVLAWLRSVIGEVARGQMDAGPVRVSRPEEKL